jgi:hypothetical protein
MVDSALLQALELLTHDEQEALLTVAEYLKHRRGGGLTWSYHPRAWLLGGSCERIPS